MSNNNQAVVVAPTNTTRREPPTETTAPRLPGYGETLAIGSWKVNIEKAERHKEIVWSGFGNKEQAKGAFIEVYLIVDNATNKTDSVNAFDYKLIDSTGAEYEACTSFACISRPSVVERVSFYEQLPPRTPTKMLVLFDVAQDAKGFVLQIERQLKIGLGDVP